MSTGTATPPVPPTPPAAEEEHQKDQPAEKATIVLPTTWKKVFNSWWGVIIVIVLIMFSSGAAYLSWIRNRSTSLAILAFVFAVVYYPYHAFTSSMSMGAPTSAPFSESPASTFMTAGKRLLKALKKH
jgi:hypothetical protein